MMDSVQGCIVLYFQRPEKGSRSEYIYLYHVGDQGRQSTFTRGTPRGGFPQSVMGSIDYLVMAGVMRSGVPSAARRLKLTHYSAPLMNVSAGLQRLSEDAHSP
jgi:hypothetical protein